MKELFLKFISTYSIKESDLLKEKFSGTLQDYKTLSTIFKVYKYIESDEDLALIQFMKMIEEIDFNIDLVNSSQEEIEKSFERSKIVKELKNKFETNSNNLYNPLLDQIFKHEFFKGETIDKNIDPNIFLLSSEWLQKGYLKKYILKEGKSKIKKIKDFQISKHLYLSDNLNYFLSNFNKEYNDDIVRTTVFFKIEKEIEYSYFIFILNYKDHVIAFSDLMEFANPFMITASRNPRRKVEDKQDSSALPYNIIDELEDIRKNNKTISKPGNDVEFYKLNWNQFSQYQRAFILLIVQKLITQLEGPAPILISAKDHLNQKLIANKDIEITNDSFEYWEGERKDYILDLTNTLLDTEVGLIKSSYNIIESNKYFDSSMIATTETHEKHARWIALKEQAEEIQNKIGRQYNMWSMDDSFKILDESKKELAKLLNKNLKSIVEKFSIANELYFLEKDKILDFRFKERTKDCGFVIPTCIIGSKYGYVGVEEKEKMCPIIPKYKGSTEYYFRIDHYSQLMYLLNCSREELPKFFRCFKSHILIPYDGNSILQNVHPMSQIYDPCSEYFSNGLKISIQISKRGFNLIKKRHNKTYTKLMVDLKSNLYEDFDTNDITYSLRI